MTISSIIRVTKLLTTITLVACGLLLPPWLVERFGLTTDTNVFTRIFIVFLSALLGIASLLLCFVAKASCEKSEESTSQRNSNQARD